MENKAYYHGSATKITGGYLNPCEQWNSVQNAKVNGAFVTSDSEYAKFFALVHCISGTGQTKLSNKKIYLEQLSKHIKPEFYIYTVYDSPVAPFIHDRGTEYYSEQPIKISEQTVCDTAQEIEKLGYEIYVMDEPYKQQNNQNKANNFTRQEYMKSMIEQKKYHRVNIAKLLAAQKTNTFKNANEQLKEKNRFGQFWQSLQSLFYRG